MRSLPVFLKMEGEVVLVVGGTSLAAARVRFLRKTPAKIAWATQGYSGPALPDGVHILNRPFRADDAQGVAAIFVATDDSDEAQLAIATARSRGIPLNVADDAAASTLTLGATIDRDPVLIAITSQGQSPSLATALRARLERTLPEGLGALAEAAGSFRSTVKAMVPSPAERRRFWLGLFNDTTLDDHLSQPPTALMGEMMRRLNQRGEAPAAGRVLLVGGGPGAADLLTLRAVRALKRADVIVYDRLVSEEVLEHARREAELIFVGKTGYGRSTSQADIEATLIREAQAGKTVVRLKGGDPLIFGRAAEELRALKAAGITAEIIPGVTAALASAAAMKIPLTDRDRSSALTLVTGVRRGGTRQDWRGLTGEGRTLAIYMGVRSAADTEAALMEDGFDPTTPVTVVEAAGRSEERSIAGPLANLSTMINAANIRSPALILVGQVCADSDARPVETAIAAAI